MQRSRTPGRPLAGRRLLTGAALAAGVLLATAAPANAATTATFNPGTGLLTVSGDSADDSITVSRNTAGNVLVDNGAISVAGGTPTVANTLLIQVFGQSGDDSIVLSQAKGPLPKANVFGGADDDTLEGGTGEDMLFGQAGDDTLLGHGGSDLLFGGADHDSLTGGDADDQVYGESGNDRTIWNPGDDSDLDEGGDGSDTIQVSGGGAAEQLTTTANGTRVRFDRLDPAPFALDIGTSERLVVNAARGDDTFSAVGNLAALIHITVDGGAGKDSILGSNGPDVLSGGDGDDFVDGQQGNDVALLGAHDDRFQWDPGDGSDTLEGQAGTDTMRFNGSAAGETFDASANGERLRFTRDVGAIVMDTGSLEVVDLRAVGGDDGITVNDLAGTDVTRVSGDLAGTVGGTTGDSHSDSVIVNGTDGPDVVEVVGDGSSASVTGLGARVDIANAEAAYDELVVNALGGDDEVSAATLPAGVIRLAIDGGAGEDDLLGSQGPDGLTGGAEADLLSGQGGDDLVFMGAGDDTFQWRPGDGSDLLEGQDGADDLRFLGANAAENIDIAADAGRVHLVRDVADVRLDLDDVEAIDVRALGGADDIVVGDLNGTDVTPIALDLGGSRAGGDGAPDTVTVNGTQARDVFGASGGAGGVNVFGLKAAVSIHAPERAGDRLTLNGLGGDDEVDATALDARGIQLAENGGLGADVLLGGDGDDVVTGGDGADSAALGAGEDVFVWNPGDDSDTVEGQAGTDRMLFNGSNAAEHITVSPNGDRVQLFRDVANVSMDLSGLEATDLRVLGGADTVVVNDLGGTDLAAVHTDLAAIGGADDGAADSVAVNATNDDDVVSVKGAAGEMRVAGLRAAVSASGATAGSDRLTVNTRFGADVVDASHLRATSALLTLDGGDGDDILIGGDGDDVLLGGLGDDVLIGGPGTDVIDGGPGDDVVLPSLGGDAVASAAVVGREWLTAHARTTNGRTVLEHRGKRHVLPRAELSRLVQDVPGR